MIQFTLPYWLAFGALVTVLLILDLGVFHRHSREPSIRSAALSTLFWCTLALVFDAYLLYAGGQQMATEFLLGYLVEWALSMDNVFVFAVIFTYFRVPKQYQYRVLFWGIIGAVVLRLAFILIGTALISRFHWVLYILAAFLVYTGIKLCFHDESFDPEHSMVIRLARRYLRVSRDNHGERFFVRENGLRAVTPLFLVMVVINFVDVAFALDSVPAIFLITENTFIVFTSNIFAILGLRALYFLLAGAMDMFRYLRFGLAAILIFVGVKMVATEWIEKQFNVKIPVWASLPVIVAFLGIAILASVIAAKREQRGLAETADGPTQPGVEEVAGADAIDGRLHAATREGAQSE